MTYSTAAMLCDALFSLRHCPLVSRGLAAGWSVTHAAQLAVTVLALRVSHAAAAAKARDKGLFANMLKGAGGVKKKPPPGVPADAADISDDAGLFKRVLTAGDPSAGSPPQGAKVQVRVFRGRLIPCPSHPMPVPPWK